MNTNQDFFSALENSQHSAEMPTWMVILYVLFIVFIIAAMWKVFTKAGKPGWAAIVPIYNIVILLEIIGRPVWWIILLFIPIVNFVISIIVYHRLSKSYGFDIGFTIGLIFLPFIFFPILGFGNAQYIGPNGEGINVNEDDDLLDQ